MASTTYAGAWRRGAAQLAVPQYASTRDPEHLNPTPSPEYEGMPQPEWVSTVEAPSLPGEVEGGDLDDSSLPQGLPLDHTPDTPDFGYGVGPGLSLNDAIEVRAASQQDFGAVAAHRWTDTFDRDATPGTEFVPNLPGNGASPETVAITETAGVGAPYDGGNSRMGRRLKRWFDRRIDMHRFETTYPPHLPKHALVTPVQEAPKPNQFTQAGPTVVANPTMSPDQFVLPFARREPVPWLQPSTQDGTVDNVVGMADEYGLGSWGQ